MLYRLLPKPSLYSRLLHHLSSGSHSYPLSPRICNSSFIILKHFSSDQNDNNNNSRKVQSTSNLWNLSSDDKFDSFFAHDPNDGSIAVINDSPAHEHESWLEDDVTESVEKESTAKNAENEWLNSEGYKMWNLEDDKDIHPFDIGDTASNNISNEAETSVNAESERIEEQKMLEKEEKELTAILKGPNRAFGDLITASGITDAMLDSLIALRDFEDIEGLPPLSEIEDMRYEKNTRKSARAEIERQKQEELAKARVRQVDDKGRAYGTGRRKCSVARVWIEPGDGKFLINDKQFDVYFPMLDHRAALLRPFSETKTLGLWDVKCTVQGGGTTGQVGAIQLGISKALQNWEPDLRPPLRNAGFLTRDPRVVERKKPGKAKARKSFQWVKR